MEDVFEVIRVLGVTLEEFAEVIGAKVAWWFKRKGPFLGHSIIPFALGKKLAEISGATFLAIPDGEHNDLAGYEEYWKGVLGFLAI